MKRTYFKAGDNVSVIKHWHNAADFTLKLDVNACGVYSLENWETQEFTICGQFEKIRFEHSPKIYGAYPLAIKNKIIGFVYNTALKLK